ncbi:NAD(P)-binding protein [Ramicandelaber brevisporus]|nr:NAD(P)-binding protein [Ramicandelaber brevisporus]
MAVLDQAVLSNFAGLASNYIYALQASRALLATSVLFGAFGLTVFLRQVISFVATLYQVYLGRGISLKKFGAGQPGHWAIVTGATDGIGKSFAQQLAKQGFNIYLISRSQHKLDAVEQEIQEQFGVNTVTQALDFSERSADVTEAYENIANTLEEINEAGAKISILVNNVGVSHDMPTPFLELADEANERMVEINVLGMLRMTRLVAPYMTRNKNGLIINMGSFAGMVPTPFLSVYSGTKAFVSTWTKAVGAELAEQGITVEHLNTFFVVSAMSKIRKAQWMIPSPDTFVKSALQRIGVSGGASDPYESSPYSAHGIAQWFTEHAYSRKYWINYNFKMQKTIRKKALAKQQKEAAAGAKQN